MGKRILNIGIALIMASGFTALFAQTDFEWMKATVYNIPVLFLVLLVVILFVAEDLRNAFKQVMRYEGREDKLPIWQVGVGMVFFATQIGLVEVFARGWMHFNLGGMPMYVIISFLNAFLLTVIFQEIFYVAEQQAVKQFKFKKLK